MCPHQMSHSVSHLQLNLGRWVEDGFVLCCVDHGLQELHFRVVISGMGNYVCPDPPHGPTQPVRMFHKLEENVQLEYHSDLQQMFIVK